MKHDLKILEDVDIREFPQERVILPSMTDTTIGDLHANALLLLNILYRRGIVDISPENYRAFAEIYTLPELQPILGNVANSRPAPIFSANDKKAKLENIYAQFNKIVDQITVIDKKTLFRLIGDELVDRGMSDYFVLKLVQKLDQEGANFEILPSNHGIEFVEACEKIAENNNKLVALRINNVAHGNSFVALNQSIEAGAIQVEEILDIYNKSYKKHLKIISYSLDTEANEIQIFSHAGIGLNHIRGLAEKFGVTYSALNAADLAKTIDNINKEFALKADANEVHKLYTHEMMWKGYSTRNQLNAADEVFAAVVWGRDYSDLERAPADFAVKFIHGHDDNDPDQTNHLTLNEKLGQFSNYKGELKFYSTSGQHAEPVNKLQTTAEGPRFDLGESQISGLGESEISDLSESRIFDFDESQREEIRQQFAELREDYVEEISALKEDRESLQVSVEKLKVDNSQLQQELDQLELQYGEAKKLLVTSLTEHLAAEEQLRAQTNILKGEIDQLKAETAQVKINSAQAVSEQRSLAEKRADIVAELLTQKELDCANLIATKLIPSSATYFFYLVAEAKKLDPSLWIQDPRQDFPAFRGDLADKEMYDKIGVKYKAMQQLLSNLTDTINTPLPSERILQFSQTLSNCNAQIKEHRDSAWVHYSKSCAIAIGIVCTGIIPGIIALLAYSAYKDKSSPLFFANSIGEEYVDTMDATLLNSPIPVG